MSHRLTLAALALALAAAALAAATPIADAAFPGHNGKIVFSRPGEIWMINADGSGQTRLIDNPLTANPDPTFSADGRRIAFASQRDGNYEIYVMNADGSDQTRLTTSPVSDDQPAFSPDGRKIAFRSYRNGNADLYLLNTDGTRSSKSGSRRIPASTRSRPSPPTAPASRSPAPATATQMSTSWTTRAGSTA